MVCLLPLLVASMHIWINAESLISTAYLPSLLQAQSAAADAGNQFDATPPPAGLLSCCVSAQLPCLITLCYFQIAQYLGGAVFVPYELGIQHTCMTADALAVLTLDCCCAILAVVCRVWWVPASLLLPKEVAKNVQFKIGVDGDLDGGLVSVIARQECVLWMTLACVLTCAGWCLHLACG